MPMITLYCQHRDRLTRAEASMAAALRDLPGVLLVNAVVARGRRTREVDGIWLHPSGVVTIEVKGTAQSGAVAAHANAPWSIGDRQADFVSGPNPTAQTRAGAQALKGALDGVHGGWIRPVSVIAGEVTLAPVELGDVTATDLTHLPEVLRESAVGGTVFAQDALAILSRLDLGDDAPTLEELHAEGFGDRPAAPKPVAAQAPRASRKDARRARRLADLEASAHEQWQRMHRRRVVSSALAGAVLAGAVPRLPWYCWVVGLSTGILTGLYQARQRAVRPGPRHHGVVAVALWLLSLAPVAGIGAGLSWMAALPVLDSMQWPFVLTLAILLACGLACAVLAGRSAWVHPPEQVLERYDEDGRATGAFTLAGPRREQWPAGDWRPAHDREPAA